MYLIVQTLDLYINILTCQKIWFWFAFDEI